MGANKKKRSGTREHLAGCGVHMRRQLNVGAERAETPITGCASPDSCIAAGLELAHWNKGANQPLCVHARTRREQNIVSKKL